ncbi:MAG: hypothetical protein ABSF48_04900 [Thermodesulfobacteriota bacterium]|jgi:hypothetical protein
MAEEKPKISGNDSALSNWLLYNSNTGGRILDRAKKAYAIEKKGG